jgi:hypothetical protein
MVSVLAFTPLGQLHEVYGVIRVCHNGVPGPDDVVLGARPRFLPFRLPTSDTLAQ